MAEKLYSAEQITVPQDLPKILKGFSKEIIRYNPGDIPQFAIELQSLSTFAFEWLCLTISAFRYFTAMKEDSM